MSRWYLEIMGAWITWTYSPIYCDWKCMFVFACKFLKLCLNLPTLTLSLSLCIAEKFFYNLIKAVTRASQGHQPAQKLSQIHQKKPWAFLKFFQVNYKVICTLLKYRLSISNIYWYESDLFELSNIYVVLYNPGQNIWHKVKRYNKIGQDFKNIIS